MSQEGDGKSYHSFVRISLCPTNAGRGKPWTGNWSSSCWNRYN